MPAAYSAVQENMSHISALEQSFVTSLHLARKLVPRYAALLDPSHIYDLEAQKVFRSLKSGKPLTTVPFSALALRAFAIMAE